MAKQKLPPLNWQAPIVDASGRPVDWFARILQFIAGNFNLVPEVEGTPEENKVARWGAGEGGPLKSSELYLSDEGFLGWQTGTPTAPISIQGTGYTGALEQIGGDTTGQSAISWTPNVTHSAPRIIRAVPRLTPSGAVTLARFFDTNAQIGGSGSDTIAEIQISSASPVFAESYGGIITNCYNFYTSGVLNTSSGSPAITNIYGYYVASNLDDPPVVNAWGFYNAGAAPNYFGVGTSTFDGPAVVPDEAYGAGWDGSLEVPTKNALYDKIETIGGGGGGGGYFKGFSGDQSGSTTFSSSYAGRGVYFTVTQNCLIDALQAVIDASGGSETYVGYLAEVASVGGAVSSILGASSSVNANGTEPYVYRLPFASSISLTTGTTYLLVVFRTDSTGTAPIRSRGSTAHVAFNAPAEKSNMNTYYFNTTALSASQTPSTSASGTSIWVGMEGTL